MKKYILVIFVSIFSFIFTACSDSKEGIDDKKVVAFISLSKVDDNTFSGFKEQLVSLGWNEGKNITYIVPGAAGSVDKLPAIVKSVIEKKPDIIFVSSTPATKEIKKQNKNIPVVFCPVNDPIRAGVVKNTKKPEGLITGVRLPASDFKRTEWLYKLVPNVKNVVVPYTPNDLSSKASRDDMKKIASDLKFNIKEIALTDPNNMQSFLNSLPKADAIVLPRDSIVESKIADFAKFAVENKLPLSVPSYQQVQKGALFTFGFIHKEIGKDGAKMVDKLLKGVKVADLPVKFGNAYLVINQKVANQIGLELSDDTIRSAKLIIKE